MLETKMTPMKSRHFFGASLLWAASLSAASYVGAMERREHYTSTVFVTVTAAPVTETVNPLDPTITKSAGWTITSGPGPSISTITSSCISYSHRLPPVNHEPEVVTYTFTTRGTVTATDTDRPLTTQTEYHTPVVTVSTARATYFSYHCLNTLVVSYADFPGAVYTWSSHSATTYTTNVCLTSSTRSTTLPGITLPANPQTPLQDWEYFSSTNLATKYTVAVISTTIVAYPGTTTSTICNNPSPTVTNTLTITRQPTTTTVLIPCQNGITGSGSGPGITRRDAPEKTPVEVHTVVYETVTVIDNAIQTLTGTAVVDVVTAEFTRTRVEYVTRVGVATVTSCTFAWMG